MLKVEIKSIPHKRHRYPGAGDYWDEKDWKIIRVSEMEDPRYEVLVALHEFVESFLCDLRGIFEQEITRFDVMFEEERENGFHFDREEPGNDKRCPYRREHRWATRIERLMAWQMKVSWKEYSEAVNAL